MTELLTDFVELPALASETRAAPCSAHALYKRCRETLNGSLGRVKQGAALAKFEHANRLNAENVEMGAQRVQIKAGKNPALASAGSV
jgi:hypothetical protein